MPGSCQLKSMDDFHSFLKGTRESVQTALDLARDYTQAELDKYIKEQINKPINEKIARKRAELIKSLQEQYKEMTKGSDEANKIIGPMNSLLDMLNGLDINKVVGAVTAIINFLKTISTMLIQGYIASIQFMALVIQHLSAILDEVNELQNIHVDGLNTKALDIKCEPISIGDITGGGATDMPLLDKLNALKTGINESVSNARKDIDSSKTESIFRDKECSCGCTPPDVPLPF